MQIRAKKCKICNHITGLLNTACEQCDSEELIVVEIENDVDEPCWTVTARKIVETTNAGFQWEDTLQSNLQDFSTWLDGHDLEFIEVMEDGKKQRRTGVMTVFWVFTPLDCVKVSELVQCLSNLRPGLMDKAQIEVEYHDSVEV
tara:strand:- start:9 stop:440 length:432 start_codon:yes stop_codon:yes gene_type:complete